MFQHLKDKHVPFFDSKSNHNTPPSDSDRGQDLTSILDRSQRGDLTVLVVELVQLMRDEVLQPFEKPITPTSTSTSTPTPSEDDSLSKESTENEKVAENQDENEGDAKEQPPPLPSRPQNTSQPGNGNGNGNGNGRKKQAAERNERIRARIKSQALSHFEDWRDSVLLRVGEVVNKNDGNQDQKDNSGSAQDAAKSNEIPLVEDEQRLQHLREVYRPIESPLADLPKATRLLILHSLLLLLLSLEHYSAYSRVLMLHVAASLGIDIKILNEDEVKVARGLLDTALALSKDPDPNDQVKKSDGTRKWKVGIASVAGAALIGVTGGLAAPLVAAGIGTIMGGLGLGATAAAGLLGTLAGSSVIVGGLFGAYGGRMTGRMMDKYAKEVDDFAFIPIRGTPPRRTEKASEAAQQDHRLRVTIGVTGWVKEESNFVIPWQVLGSDSEVFALRWEMEPLTRLGNALTALVTSAAWSVAGTEILSRTIFASIMTAVMLPMGLLKLASVVDNPFSVAKARADKAGEVLADALISKVQGERPVTLIGYSLGSRLIFSCLQSLAKRGAYGLIESVIMMGSPTPSTAEHWRRIRSVVSGRVVNVYSEHDTVLAFLYRTSSLQLGIAGLQPVNNVPGVENLNVSEMISGHLRYQFLLGKIMKTIGLQDLDYKEIEREELALALEDKRQEEERQKHEEEAGVKDRESSTARETLNSKEGFGEEMRMQKQVESRTEENLTQHRIQMLDLDDDEDYSEPLVDRPGKHSAL